MEVEILLKRIEKGDEESFAKLVNLYTQVCYRIAWRQLLDSHAAEDVVQDVLFKIWRKPSMWKASHGCRFETWLYRVVINRCIDYQRKRRWWLTGSYNEQGAGKGESCTVFEPESVRLRHERQEMLKSALSRLESRPRAALNLFYYEQMSQKQIAEVMETTPKAVESLIARARKELKEICNAMEATGS